MSRSITDGRVTVGLCLLAFLVLLSYAISGTASQSLFLMAYGNSLLPWVWLGVAGVTVVTATAVNELAARMSVAALFIRTTYFSAALLGVLLAGLAADLPGMAFLIYIWKDVYVVVLLELFWTFANVAFAVDSAATRYGWFCAAGSLGAIVGNLVLAPLAEWMGTVHTLWLTLPVLGGVAWGCRYLGRDVHLPATRKVSADWRAGWGVLRRSRYLGLLLLLVATVQVTVTLMDFQFSEILQASYPEIDGRTAALGYVNAVINLASMVLQVGTAPLLRALGVRGTLLMLPVILGGAVLGFMAAPRFAAMAVVKVVSKTADYSVFRTSKEILYIPLSYAEKTQGKALVDMLTYRVAKGGASLLVLGLAGMGRAGWLSGLDLVLCITWLALTVPIVGRFGRAQGSSTSAEAL